MPHLAAFAGLVFFVQMDSNARNCQRAVEMRRMVEPEIAEQVSDGGRLNDRNVAQGQVIARIGW